MIQGKIYVANAHHASRKLETGKRNPNFCVDVYAQINTLPFLVPYIMIVFFSIFSCQYEHTTTKKEVSSVDVQSTEKHSIDVQSLHQKLQSPPIIIDVRTPEEFDSGHIPTATNIPLQDFADHIKNLEKHKQQEIYLVCAAGVRSQQATNMLLQQGFTKAINVEGGTRGWKAKGFPTD